MLDFKSHRSVRPRAKMMIGQPEIRRRPEKAAPWSPARAVDAEFAPPEEIARMSRMTDVFRQELGVTPGRHRREVRG